MKNKIMLFVSLYAGERVRKVIQHIDNLGYQWQLTFLILCLSITA